MIATITENDIEFGKPEDESYCPIALFLRRQDGITKVCVMETYVELLLKGVHWRVDLPRVAKRFIKLFDNGKPVKPFRFTLNVPHGTNTYMTILAFSLQTSAFPL